MTPLLKTAGPLCGVTVVEFAGLAPVPFAGLILADFGANVIRIDRPVSSHAPVSPDFLCRNKRSLAIDLKDPRGLETIKRLIRRADVLIDSFRPGVLEKMGLGPDVWLGSSGQNGNLVFARLPGFKQGGPNSDRAGHDINYLALSGVLSLLPGTSERPSFPLNLLADFAGGGLICAMGVLFALIERQRSGKGQVVDADMVSGTRYVATFPMLHAALQSSVVASSESPRQSNLLDGGAPFYNVYTCADERHVAVGCLEPQFFRIFLDRFLIALPSHWLKKQSWIPDIASHGRKEEWPVFRKFMDKAFRLKPRDEWAAVFHGVDACVTPVLDPMEAAALAAPGDASLVPSPSPSLSRTPATAHLPFPDVLLPGQHSKEVLLEAGLHADEVADLVKAGIVGIASQAQRSKL